MDEKQLHYEFMSILSESHPGLTFEEYRDTSVFLLFYQYLCLQCGEKLEEQYTLRAMVRTANRGKLQMPVFIRFIEAADPFIRMAGSRFRLTEFTFYRNICKVQSLEKQKSYARFIRKIIKKIEAWESCAQLSLLYGDLFEEMMGGFARLKKETYISEDLLHLHRMFYADRQETIRRVFLPDFQYGILLHTMVDHLAEAEVFGYEERDSLTEMLRMLCYMKQMPVDAVHLSDKAYWMESYGQNGAFDAVSIFLPDGVEPGNLVGSATDSPRTARLMKAVTKGEFPLILSALSLLDPKGIMTVVMPSALLYREGKEAQIRQYLVQEMNCLDVVMLLPDHTFQSTGQNEVLLFFQKNRDREDVLFFDCSEVDRFEGETLHSIETAWKERKTIPGFCSAVSQKVIEENDYNLNLPRYISRSVQVTRVDIEQRRQRIQEIDRELKEIEQKIAMYRRDLEL